MKKLLLCLTFLTVTPAFADIEKKINTPENRTILQKVEKAYNNIKTLKADFAQFNSKVKNDLQTGTLYMSKPGQMRLVYQKGSPLEFYANNGYLIYHDKDLKEVNKGQSIGIIIGSEGGFSIQEVEYAVKCGYKSVTLGKRILRSETACIYALSVISYLLEDK